MIKIKNFILIETCSHSYSTCIYVHTHTRAHTEHNSHFISFNEFFTTKDVKPNHAFCNPQLPALSKVNSILPPHLLSILSTS